MRNLSIMDSLSARVQLPDYRRWACWWLCSSAAPRVTRFTKPHIFVVLPTTRLVPKPWLQAVGALVAVLIGGSAGGKEAAAVALANISAGSKDVAVRPHLHKSSTIGF